MATFEAQVEGLTSLSIDGSSAPTQTELTQFLTDGAKEILSVIPKQKRAMYSTSNTLDSGDTTLTIGGSEVLGVTRNDGTIDQPCRRIPLSLSGRAQDSEEMIYGTVTDPVWWITINALNMFPTPTDAQNGLIQTLAYPAVAFGDSSITKFPDEAEYLIPIYASIKAIQNALGAKAGNSDITTALTAINTELDETQAVCDKIDTDLVLAKAEVVLAKAEAAEIASNTDNGSDFETACDAMVTELNKVDEIIVEASVEFDKVDNVIVEGSVELDKSTALLDLGEVDSQAEVATAYALLITAVAQAATAADKFTADASDSVFGDEATFLTADSQLTRVKAAIDNAEDVINSNQPSTTTDAYGAQSSEDIELVKSALSIAGTELQRAQMHLAEWTAIGDMRVKEVNVALAEADGQVKVIQTHLQQAQAKRSESQSRLAAGGAYLQEANGIIAQGNAYLQEAQSYISQANGYAAEVNARSSFVSAKSQAVQGHINTAQGYVATAQGFSNEIQAKIGIAQGYANEIQSRMSVLTTEYTWLEKQQAKLQADYDKGLQMIAGA